ncbi:hypothetical protein KCP70_02730 [Salmonella enterica subsp. enterica]|nr:hypothetical protein KCP70_02730 [Salmonella enterica subsp. enterica]
MRLIMRESDGLDYFTTVPASFGRRTVSGVAAILPLFGGDEDCLSVARSLGVCRGVYQKLSRMPRVQASMPGRASQQLRWQYGDAAGLAEISEGLAAWGR